MVSIIPSIICGDWKKGDALNNIRSLGIRCLHADIIDGKFSPVSPLSFDDLSEMFSNADRAEMPLDFHIMAHDNEKYVEQALEFKPYQICFHIETCLHTDRLLRIIRSAGIRCGVALCPATPISAIEYAAEVCDYVLLMLINPGYADDKNESMVPYAYRKIEACRKLLDKTGRSIDIELDGRVSFTNAGDLVKAGGNILVAGTSSLFSRSASLEDNYKRLAAAAGGII